ncbi:MAG: STAS domain-containing protein [Candidatus Tectomicrobia bacterium]|uniref:STAS domain-containing protein n=1 Tax=Tectimicrobiota bacterium TaxID=2528274 RepID=A0A932MQ62_UNCTE|nr:STAS domain-containing protein [Candidatus Tectomicrobia bacterium]
MCAPETFFAAVRTWPSVYTPKLVTELKGYDRGKLVSDLFAGITVGVVALPLAMAFAIASGLPPERGLFTAIVAGLMISALGGSKVQIGGPTGAFVVIVSGIVGQYGYAGLALCTLMAGVLLILFGLFRLGGLIRFIPFPVTTGFTTGIAVVIFSTQIKPLLGLRMEAVPSEFLPQWQAYLAHLDSLNFSAAALGAGTIGLILLVRRLFPRWPALLIGMAAAAAASSWLGLDVETIGARFGDLPRVLPAPSLPEVRWEDIGGLLKPAMTVALLAAVESLLSASVADGMIGGHHRPNAELIAQGAANIGSVIFGGIPATGAIARTATNARSGARTPVAGIIHALVLMALLLLFAPLAKQIPLAALAGILVVVSYNMSELHHFRSILKGPKSDAFVLALTFVLTVVFDLTLAVEVGIALAALLFIRQMSKITNVSMVTSPAAGDGDRREDLRAISLREVPHGVEVFEVNGPFFFGMIDTFKNAVRNVKCPTPVLIIRIRNVQAMDATGIHTLRELRHRCGREGTALVFSGVNPQPLAAFQRSGLMQEVGRENFCANIDEALARARAILAGLEREEAVESPSPWAQAKWPSPFTGRAERFPRDFSQGFPGSGPLATGAPTRLPHSVQEPS